MSGSCWLVLPRLRALTSCGSRPVCHRRIKAREFRGDAAQLGTRGWTPVSNSGRAFHKPCAGANSLGLQERPATAIVVHTRRIGLAVVLRCATVFRAAGVASMRHMAISRESCEAAGDPVCCICSGLANQSFRWRPLCRTRKGLSAAARVDENLRPQHARRLLLPDPLRHIGHTLSLRCRFQRDEHVMSQFFSPKVLPGQLVRASRFRANAQARALLCFGAPNRPASFSRFENARLT